MIADPQLREFAEVTGRPDGRIDLARAALAIARWEYPGLDVEEYLDRLDALARGVDGLRRSADPVSRLHRLREYGPRLTSIRTAVEEHLASRDTSAALLQSPIRA